MSPGPLGALLGLTFAAGVLLAVGSSPPARRPRLTDRLAPYFPDRRPTSRLLGADPSGPSRVGVAVAAGRLLRPTALRAAGLLERLLGGGRSIERRLTAAGSPLTLPEFRLEQVGWGAMGSVVGATAAVGAVAAGRGGSLVAALLLPVVGAFGGVLGRDWRLTTQAHRRAEAMLTELPIVAELLALAVTAGEAPGAALERISRLSHGPLGQELAAASSTVRAGASLPAALEAVTVRHPPEAVARFLDGVVIALERGTPLSDVLRAQAVDAREARKRALLASGGRREIAMMLPVVFLILPVTVLFALYPGLVTLTLLAH